MATTEIEKLERRYAENPQGLTFAPLAEIHRKNGDVARALELLRAGLELHPNYIPASIVLGRCHWDLDDLAAAESAFSHVLRLDDENVIALKSLADINEKLGRTADAQRWLNRLISVDRSNEEARQQLARLESGKHQPPAAEPPAAAAAPRDVPAPKVEPAASRLAPAAPEPARPEPVPTSLDLAVELTETASAPAAEEPAPAPVLEFIDTSTPAGSSPEARAEDSAPPGSAPVDGLISQEFVPPRDTYRAHPELTQEFVSPESPRLREGPELEVETVEEVELQSSGASEFRVPNAAEDFMDAVAAVMRPSEPPAPPPREVAPPPLEAIRASVEPAPAPVLRVEPEPRREAIAAEPAPSSYSVRVTRGQSVVAFFAALLSARPPGTPAGTAPVSQPTAAGAPAGDGQAPPPPGGPVAAAGPLADAEVSFDDFFGTAEPSPFPKGNSDSGKEDLDEFQSWLQNLKR
jgi:hypothetical protein